ncbi:hypothetical protein C7M84_003722 [Penaeus vannamei]|uniref:Uncharacterized protein n=1 Tax=Penaeus vannamei TaxID=6689 RepID=A0A423TME8_PENVA|nr:hypothetical protein C7M84_003722 [Penaeus vannamei]
MEKGVSATRLDATADEASAPLADSIRLVESVGAPTATLVQPWAPPPAPRPNPWAPPPAPRPNPWRQTASPLVESVGGQTGQPLVRIPWAANRQATSALYYPVRVVLHPFFNSSLRFCHYPSASVIVALPIFLLLLCVLPRSSLCSFRSPAYFRVAPTRKLSSFSSRIPGRHPFLSDLAHALPSFVRILFGRPPATLLLRALVLTISTVSLYLSLLSVPLSTPLPSHSLSPPPPFFIPTSPPHSLSLAPHLSRLPLSASLSLTFPLALSFFLSLRPLTPPSSNSPSPPRVVGAIGGVLGPPALKRPDPPPPLSLLSLSPFFPLSLPPSHSLSAPPPPPSTSPSLSPLHPPSPSPPLRPSHSPPPPPHHVSLPPPGSSGYRRWSLGPALNAPLPLPLPHVNSLPPPSYSPSHSLLPQGRRGYRRCPLAALHAPSASPSPLTTPPSSPSHSPLSLPLLILSPPQGRRGYRRCPWARLLKRPLSLSPAPSLSSLSFSASLTRLLFLPPSSFSLSFSASLALSLSLPSKFSTLLILSPATPGLVGAIGGASGPIGGVPGPALIPLTSPCLSPPPSHSLSIPPGSVRAIGRCPWGPGISIAPISLSPRPSPLIPSHSLLTLVTFPSHSPPPTGSSGLPRRCRLGLRLCNALPLAPSPLPPPPLPLLTPPCSTPHSHIFPQGSSGAIEVSLAGLFFSQTPLPLPRPHFSISLGPSGAIGVVGRGYRRCPLAPALSARLTPLLSPPSHSPLPPPGSFGAIGGCAGPGSHAPSPSLPSPSSLARVPPPLPSPSLSHLPSPFSHPPRSSGSIEGVPGPGSQRLLPPLPSPLFSLSHSLLPSRPAPFSPVSLPPLNSLPLTPFLSISFSASLPPPSPLILTLILLSLPPGRRAYPEVSLGPALNAPSPSPRPLSSPLYSPCFPPPLSFSLPSPVSLPPFHSPPPPGSRRGYRKVSWARFNAPSPFSLSPSLSPFLSLSLPSLSNSSSPPSLPLPRPHFPVPHVSPLTLLPLIETLPFFSLSLSFASPSLPLHSLSPPPFQCRSLSSLSHSLLSLFSSSTFFPRPSLSHSRPRSFSSPSRLSLPPPLTPLLSLSPTRVVGAIGGVPGPGSQAPPDPPLVSRSLSPLSFLSSPPSLSFLSRPSPSPLSFSTAPIPPPPPPSNSPSSFSPPTPPGRGLSGRCPGAGSQRLFHRAPPSCSSHLSLSPFFPSPSLPLILLCSPPTLFIPQLSFPSHSPLSPPSPLSFSTPPSPSSFLSFTPSTPGLGVSEVVPGPGDSTPPSPPLSLSLCPPPLHSSSPSLILPSPRPHPPPLTPPLILSPALPRVGRGLSEVSLGPALQRPPPPLSSRLFSSLHFFASPPSLSFSLPLPSPPPPLTPPLTTLSFSSPPPGSRRGLSEGVLGPALNAPSRLSPLSAFSLSIRSLLSLPSPSPPCLTPPAHSSSPPRVVGAIGGVPWPALNAPSPLSPRPSSFSLSFSCLRSTPLFSPLSFSRLILSLPSSLLSPLPRLILHLSISPTRVVRGYRRCPLGPASQRTPTPPTSLLSLSLNLLLPSSLPPSHSPLPSLFIPQLFLSSHSLPPLPFPSPLPFPLSPPPPSSHSPLTSSPPGSSGLSEVSPGPALNAPSPLSLSPSPPPSLSPLPLSLSLSFSASSPSLTPLSFLSLPPGSVGSIEVSLGTLSRPSPSSASLLSPLSRSPLLPSPSPLFLCFPPRSPSSLSPSLPPLTSPSHLSPPPQGRRGYRSVPGPGSQRPPPPLPLPSIPSPSPPSPLLPLFLCFPPPLPPSLSPLTPPSHSPSFILSSLSPRGRRGYRGVPGPGSQRPLSSPLPLSFSLFILLLPSASLSPPSHSPPLTPSLHSLSLSHSLLPPPSNSPSHSLSLPPGSSGLSEVSWAGSQRPSHLSPPLSLLPLTPPPPLFLSLILCFPPPSLSHSPSPSLLSLPSFPVSHSSHSSHSHSPLPQGRRGYRRCPWARLSTPPTPPSGWSSLSPSTTPSSTSTARMRSRTLTCNHIPSVFEHIIAYAPPPLHIYNTIPLHIGLYVPLSPSLSLLLSLFFTIPFLHNPL